MFLMKFSNFRCYPADNIIERILITKELDMTETNLSKIKIGDDLYVVDADQDGWFDPQIEDDASEGGILIRKEDDYFVNGNGQKITRFETRCNYWKPCYLESEPYSIYGSAEAVYKKVLLSSSSEVARGEAAKALGLSSANQEDVQKWLFSKGFEFENDIWTYAEFLKRCTPDFALDKLLELSKIKTDNKDIEAEAFYRIAMKEIMSLSLQYKGDVKTQFDIFLRMAGVEFDEAGLPRTRAHGSQNREFFEDREISVGQDVDLYVAGQVARDIGRGKDLPVIDDLISIAVSKDCNVCVRCYAMRMLDMAKRNISNERWLGIEAAMKGLLNDSDEIIRDCAKELLK